MSANYPRLLAGLPEAMAALPWPGPPTPDTTGDNEQEPSCS